VDTLVCVHLLLTNFALCFTLVRLSFLPSCFGLISFNNLSLPWTWSNVLKFGCVKNHKRPVNFDFDKSRGIYVPCAPFFHFNIFFAGKIQNYNTCVNLLTD
jgi:hypothetical protein